MVKGQAIRPNFFNNLPTIIRDQQAKEKGVSEEELQLYALSQSGGWRILREYTDGLLKDLDQVTTTAMQQGMAFEEIGRNAIVANLAKGVITRILQKVEDARDASERPDGTIR
jgi:hypothetical protein